MAATRRVERNNNNRMLALRPPLARQPPFSACGFQVHALAHGDLEAPLLLAAALIVQAAQAVALGRLRRCTAAAASAAATGAAASSCRPARPPDTAAAAPTKRQRGAARGSSSGNTDGGKAGLVAPSAGGGAAERLAPACCPRALDEEEEAATGDVTEALFPRGLLRKLPPREEEGDEGGDTSAVFVEKSWVLLTQALEATRLASNTAGVAGAADSRPRAGAEGDAVAVINPREFPLLLSRRVHELVVCGLAANLMEVEVRRGGGGQGRVRTSSD